MRFFGGISNAESGLGSSQRPSRIPLGTHCEPGLCSTARSGDPIGGEGDAVATPHAQSGGAASRTTVPRGMCGWPQARAAGAILKPDPQSPSLCVSDRRRRGDGEPSPLEARTLRTRRLAGETAGGDMAGSERGLRGCHSASP